MFGFIVAVLFSVCVLGVCLFLIVYGFLHPKDGFQVGCWPETTISFLLGVWVTDRPRFAKKSNK